MHHIVNKVDFYITNVCNLTCEGCNRFNNYDFRGWQKWSDYSDHYRRWSQLVTLQAATIMGGEPFLNPSLPQWVRGLNQYFGIEVQILTNGTRFLQARDLYKELLYKSNRTKAKNHIGVSLHNLDQAESLDQGIRSFLYGKIEKFEKGHARNPFNADYVYVDQNRIMVNVYVVTTFTNSTLRQVVPVPGSSPRFELHNSDPAIAHNNCAFATFKSYHFIRGKLYKCAPVALLPEFDQQHNILMSDEDRVLMNSYQPLTVDNFDSYHSEFFENLDKQLPQCKFCPAHYTFKLIKGTRKGTENV